MCVCRYYVAVSSKYLYSSFCCLCCTAVMFGLLLSRLALCLSKRVDMVRECCVFPVCLPSRRTCLCLLLCLSNLLLPRPVPLSEMIKWGVRQASITEIKSVCGMMKFPAEDSSRGLPVESQTLADLCQGALKHFWWPPFPFKNPCVPLLYGWHLICGVFYTSSIHTHTSPQSRLAVTGLTSKKSAFFNSFHSQNQNGNLYQRWKLVVTESWCLNVDSVADLAVTSYAHLSFFSNLSLPASSPVSLFSKRRWRETGVQLLSRPGRARERKTSWQRLQVQHATSKHTLRFMHIQKHIL